MEHRYENKVVLVTGGSQGIGRGIAERFAQEGADVVITGRHEETLKEVADKYEKMTYVVSDLTVDSDVQKIADYIKDNFNKLDVLVNNAGWCPLVPLKEITMKDYDRAFNLDVRGLLNMTVSVLPLIIKGQGNIINISSVGAQRPSTLISLYAGAKAAVDNFTRVWAQELAEDNVRVNAIAPGNFNTSIWHKTDMSREAEDENLERMSKMAPIRRLGEPSEIGALAAYLASDEAAYITGSIYNIDGGMAAK